MKRITTILIVLATSVQFGCQQLPVRDFETTIEGSYDTETRYNMSSFQGVFGQLAGQWRNPDNAIYNQIAGSIEAQYGSTIGSTFVSVYGSQLQSDITGYLASEAPPWVLQMGTRLDEVDAQMKTVDLQTTMLVTEDDASRVSATQIWNGVAFYKNPDCPDSSALTCDQFELNTQELLEAEYPIEVLSSDFTATTTDDVMSLDAHSVDFNYGRLGLYLLVNQILPDDPSEGVGMRDLALGAINCRGLAGRLAGDDGTYGVNVGGVDVGLSVNDLVGNCEDGVLSSVNGFVDRFNVPLGMDLTGQAELVDTNRDGTIDQFTGGQVDGDMAVQLIGGQSEEGPVSGQFIGFRVGDVP